MSLPVPSSPHPGPPDAPRAPDAPAAARARLALLAATTAHLVAYASAWSPGGAPRWAAWLFALATVVAMAALIVLGAVRGRGGIGALAAPLALMATLLGGGFATALALPAPTAASPLWLGLPPAAAVVVYGIGLLPALVLPVAYARSFDAHVLADADLARLRAEAARRRGASEPPPGAGAAGPAA